MTYQVSLDVFHGPFDLLLHLIARRRLDVAEVDLADITADYLASLDGLADIDLESASRFLVVAATLVELKASRLLPTTRPEELEDALGAARDLLYARLLEYRAFRSVATVLRGWLDVHARFVGRTAGLDPGLGRRTAPVPLHVDAAHLAALAARATAPRPEPTIDLTHIRHTLLSLQAAAAIVRERLDVGASATFDSLVGGRDRSDRVVLFLALLELYKLGELDLDQPDHRGVLLVRRIAADDGLPDLSEPRPA